MALDFIQFSNTDFWNLINERHSTKGGVYRVVAMKDGKPVEVNRFLGTDDEGVLYIGKAISFLDRVADLKKSISPTHKGQGHDFGVRYKDLEIPNIALRFPYDELYVHLIQTDSPDELERTMLKAYRSKFGEVPPLNAVG
jgi:hypothetical protein